MSKAKPVAICTTPGQVHTAAKKGYPWKAYLEYRGPNYENVSGKSRKFWEITGRGFGTVTVRWGRIGSAGSSQQVDFHTACERLAKKQYDGGYQFKAAA